MRLLRSTPAPLLLVGALACLASVSQSMSESTAPSGDSTCYSDLDFAAAFLLENDAGVQGLGWTTYPAKVVEALDRERSVAADARSPATCAASINRFLQSIRRGHLAAVSLAGGEVSTGDMHTLRAVNSRRLSAQTTYIQIPSFGEGIHGQLVDLVETNKHGVRDAAHLVIDVRGNHGGNDSAFEPLLSLLGPATYRAPTAEIFVTAANITGWEAVVPQVSHPDDAEWLDQVIGRMKDAGAGWIATSSQTDWVFHYKERQVRANPLRVVLLIDEGCGSSCEQFVVTARQNERVVTMGRRTFGALDASNLRRVSMPSRQVAVDYATSFVRRPGGQQIDGVGIAPDLELPSPTDDEARAAEVEIARQYVERPE